MDAKDKSMFNKGLMAFGFFGMATISLAEIKAGLPPGTLESIALNSSPVIGTSITCMAGVCMRGLIDESKKGDSLIKSGAYSFVAGIAASTALSVGGYTAMNVANMVKAIPSVEVVNAIEMTSAVAACGAFGAAIAHSPLVEKLSEKGLAVKKYFTKLMSKNVEKENIREQSNALEKEQTVKRDCFSELTQNQKKLVENISEWVLENGITDKTGNLLAFQNNAPDTYKELSRFVGEAKRQGFTVNEKMDMEKNDKKTKFVVKSREIDMER